MHDSKYCYPNSNVLKNKLGITEENDLFEAEKDFTFLRLKELQQNPIKGKYDFTHLKAIHKYIFQDIYEWAGEERTVEIGKGNLFCTTSCIQSYAESVFNKYFYQCYGARNNFDDFIRIFSDNYGDLNALHPFREGNGRSQREFARLVCLKCGYVFDLSGSTHSEMLEASKLSFDKADSSGFIKIFSKAIKPLDKNKNIAANDNVLGILTSDDLILNLSSGYDSYEYEEYPKSDIYNNLYQAKILEMNVKKRISDVKESLRDYNSKNTPMVDAANIQYDQDEQEEK